MATGQIYMLLALVSFSMLGVFHKLADVKQSRPSAINALLYGWSLLFVLGLVFVRGAGPSAPSTVITIAVPFGISASVAILAFQAGIKHGKIATSWLAINLSAGIPTIASILIYDEPVQLRQALALSLIPIAIGFLWKDKADDERRRALRREGPPREPDAAPMPVTRGGSS
jgi:drug/metabolite transporter (DMT)-like permease